LCGVGQNAISKYIKNTQHTIQVNELSQLDMASSILVIAHYALDSQRVTQKALSTYRQINENNLDTIKKIKEFLITHESKQL